MSDRARAQAVDTLLGPYRTAAGTTLYDEHVTETEHALQCADLAIDAGAPDHLVVAALFHDIGHLVAGGVATSHDPMGRDDRHELSGARLLRRWFGPEVAAPVAHHVAAKRYLVTVEPGYLDGLSPASVHSLELQGGAFPRQCIDEVERRPRWLDGVSLRRWDDAAKVPGRSTRTLDEHADRIVRLLR
jgi:predicted HD phosphohydrolase